MASRLQVRPERPEQLGLVVDDEDARHSAALSRKTIVSPPPGVSSVLSILMRSDVQQLLRRDTRSKGVRPVGIRRSSVACRGHARFSDAADRRSVGRSAARSVPSVTTSSTSSRPSGRCVINRIERLSAAASTSWIRDAAVGVEVRGRLVEHEHGRVREQRAGDDEALALPAGELAAVLADERVPAVGKRAHPVQDPRSPERVLDLVIGRVGAAEADVLADRRRRRGASPGPRRRSCGGRPPGGSRAGRGRRA